MRGSRHFVVGTAGHIDHGKTALVKALTGQDTDRLPQEKERGISIDLGFAHLDLQGMPVAIVDVPGHERFIKNMLAGVSGIDMALMVVAADEGPMPQTREHLDILDLLGVDRGIVAVTKADLVDEEWLNLVGEETRLLLAGTTLENAPIVKVSAATGRGIDQLREALAVMLRDLDSRGLGGLSRVPVDRVFTVAGFGTVVTGTLVAGEILNGQRLDVVPDGFTVKVRQVEVHGDKVDKAEAGQRVALNLSKVERKEVSRGSVLAEPGTLTASWQFAGEFRLLSRVRRPLATSSRVRLHVGTSEIMGRLMLLDRDQVGPGEATLVRFKAERPMAVARGDRFIIRSYSPAITIGGGRIVAVKGRFRRHNSRDLHTLQQLQQAKGQDLILVELGLQSAPVDVRDVAVLVGEGTGAVGEELLDMSRQGKVIFWQQQGLVIHSSVYDGLVRKVTSFLDRYHSDHPMRRGVPREELRGKVLGHLDQRQFGAVIEAMAGDSRVVINKEFLSLPGREKISGDKARETRMKVEEEFKKGGFNPPAVKDVPAVIGFTPQEVGDVVRLLLDEGILVRVEGEFIFHQAIIEEAKERVTRYIKDNESMTVAGFRDLLGTSRKYALPLLSYLDSVRFTKRDGDLRRLYNP